ISVKFHQIRDFLAVARNGSIRAASRELGIAQPSITKSIRQLEASLDVPLFERSSTGLSLTSFGETFYKRTRGAMNELTRARDEMKQMRDTHTGSVVFSMGGVSLLTLLPGAIKTFQRRYPKVAIRVVERASDQAFLELRNGELDFAVIVEPA